MFYQNSQHYYYLAVRDWLIIFVVYNLNLIFERLELMLKIFEIQFRIFFVLKEFVLNQKRTRIEIHGELAYQRFTKVSGILSHKYESSSKSFP